MSRSRSFVYVLPLAFVLLHSGPASGDTLLPALDRSTVRVFAIGSVGVEDVALHQRTLRVASTRAGHGTGFIVGPGMVITAAHVVDDARNIVVRLPESGGFFAARVAYIDKEADISVLAFDADRETSALAPLVFAKDRGPRVRDAVFAVGYPVDATRKSPQSARGIIAGRLDDGTIQLDMTLNGGNSGGPLINQDDFVIGMVVARGAVEKGIQGIGYAVQVERLIAALAEAQRRLAKGQVPPLAKTANQSAVVVDEMVQHGALREVRAAADVAGGLRVANVERALSSLLARLEDPDLLVFVAASMWNAALAIELSDLRELHEVGIHAADAAPLAHRLRASAARACGEAVRRDATVRQRSAFVDLALYNTGAPALAGERVQPSTVVGVDVAAPPRRRAEFSLRGGPLARWNPNTASVGLGFGLSTDVRWTSGRIFGFVGATFAEVSVDVELYQVNHSILASDLGVGAKFGARGQVELAASIGAALYTTDSMSSIESVTDTELTGRLGLDYRLAWLRLGTGARVFEGPTFWLEPINVGFTF
ncbi:MAG TPA: serine protease [Kofleriaceae bacterium]